MKEKILIVLLAIFTGFLLASFIGLGIYIHLVAKQTLSNTQAIQQVVAGVNEQLAIISNSVSAVKK